MLTFFTTPKPFIGHIADIQTNAALSWSALRPSCDIIIFGDEDGSGDVARVVGARHVRTVERNAWGTPLLDGLFNAARRLARHDYLCYVNADIILTDEFVRVASRIMSWRERFLMVGRRITIDVKGVMDIKAADWAERLRADVRRAGSPDSSHAIDFFLFHKDCFGSIPPFAIGRFTWDNWLLYSARSRRVPVVDITRGFVAIHQQHDYAKWGGALSLWNSEEARINRELAGGGNQLLTLDDASHIFDGRRVRRNLSGLRLRRAAVRRIRALAPSAVAAFRPLSSVPS